MTCTFVCSSIFFRSTKCADTGNCTSQSAVEQSSLQSEPFLSAKSGLYQCRIQGTSTSYIDAGSLRLSHIRFQSSLSSLSGSSSLSHFWFQLSFLSDTSFQSLEPTSFHIQSWPFPFNNRTPVQLSVTHSATCSGFLRKSLLHTSRWRSVRSKWLQLSASTTRSVAAGGATVHTRTNGYYGSRPTR